MGGDTGGDTGRDIGLTVGAATGGVVVGDDTGCTGSDVRAATGAAVGTSTTSLPKATVISATLAVKDPAVTSRALPVPSKLAIVKTPRAARAPMFQL